MNKNICTLLYESQRGNQTDRRRWLVFIKAERKPQTVQAPIKKRLVTLAIHKMSDEIAPGTLNSIFKQAQIKKK
jgi:hypothetical protein